MSVCVCVWRTSCAGVGFNCVAHFACQYQHTIHCSYYRPTSTPTSDRETHTHLHTQSNVLHLSSAKISYTNFNSVSNNKQNTQQLKHTNTPTPTNSHSQSYTVTHSLTHTHTDVHSSIVPAVCPPGQVSTNVHVNIMRSTRDTAQYDNSQTHSHTYTRT